MTCHGIDDYVRISNHDLQIQELAQQILSIINLISSLSVVMILSIRYKKLVEDKPFMFYILMIAISDSFVSLAFTFGFPSQGLLCSTQGFLFMLFGRASWCWTLLLIFQLYYLAIYTKVYFGNWFSFKLVWSFSLISNLIPLACKVWYGIQDNLAGTEACFFNGANSSEEIFVFWWVLEQIVIFFLILVLSIRVLFHTCLQERSNLTSHKVGLLSISKSIKSTMVLYPMSMLITWSPAIIYIFFNRANADNNCMRLAHPVYGGNFVNMLQPLYGFLMSIVFYSRSNGGQEWFDLIKSLFYKTSNNNIDINNSINGGSVDLSPIQSNELI